MMLKCGWDNSPPNNVQLNMELITKQRKGKETTMKMTKINEFMSICKQTQVELKVSLTETLKKYYENVYASDGFVYAIGSDPILVTAHMDTVHRNQCKKIAVKKNKGKTILSSKDGIGGDDRCGIYMILRILKETKLRPYVLFCEDEEIGGVGSDKFVKAKWDDGSNVIDDLDKILFMIELDRAHDKDLVYYEDANKEFHKFCESVTGYTEDYGTFSDISNLSPEIMCSSVNISCGYYNAHTTSEYVVFEEMENSIKATIKLITEGLAKGVRFEYEEEPYRGYYGYGYTSRRYGSGYSALYDRYFKDDDQDKEEEEKEFDYFKGTTRTCQFFDVNGNVYTIEGFSNFNEAVGKLMQENADLRWNDVVDYDEYEY